MTRLLIKLVVLSLVVSLSWWLCIARVTAGFEDRFYTKFRFKAGSMVAGTSRALLGLDPSTLDPEGKYDSPFLNFAFTQSTSPYGEIYYSAIRSKLDPEVRNGIFILEVNPASVYSKAEADLPEAEHILAEMKFYSLDPNYEYIVRNGAIPVYLFMFSHSAEREGVVMHENGWNEDRNEIDQAKRDLKITEQRSSHERMFSTHQFSEYRMLWLRNTITLLQSHGRVVLLRVPVSDTMRALENKYYPDFESLMQVTAREMHVSYFSFISDTTYEFYDVHHMNSVSALRFSSVVRDSIVGRTGN